MTRKERQSKKDNWKTVEKVVRLLESSIDPSAEVRHDVRLPDFDTDGGTTQCDVVIDTGVEARRTRTIVEVQDRNKPMGIPDLRSFIQKMRSVRAHQLVCVAKVGFSRNAIDFANTHGPCIRLVTLSELEKSSWPVNIAFGRWVLLAHDTKPVACSLKGSKYDDHMLDRSSGKIKTNMQDRMFEYRPSGGISSILTVAELYQTAVDKLPYFSYRKEPYLAVCRGSS